MRQPSPFVITYFTDDLAANREFYGGILGLPQQSELPDTYVLLGNGGWRLQILRIEPGRPGRETVSSGLVLIGVEDGDELAELHTRLRAHGLSESDGYRDPDGRIVMLQLFDASRPFHD